VSHILTLITRQDADLLTNAFLQGLAQDLSPESAWKCLAPKEAYECEIGNPADVGETCQQFVGAHPIDFAITPAKNRQKKLLLADMDSTIITAECIDEIADVIGLKGQVAEITERAMRGEVPFDDALRERVGLLKGLPAEKLQAVYDERIELTPGARTLVQTMKANGAYAALISGGFTFFTRRVAAACGFDIHQGNTLDIKGGVLSGAVPDPILGREAKLEALVSLREQVDLQAEQTLAVGDGANDLAMLNEAGLGVAFHAKPIVAAEAHCAIEHTDLTSLLYIQGYSKDEFAS
jgi:phosphoserine phosphatase